MSVSFLPVDEGTCEAGPLVTMSSSGSDTDDGAFSADVVIPSSAAFRGSVPLYLYTAATAAAVELSSGILSGQFS